MPPKSETKEIDGMSVTVQQYAAIRQSLLLVSVAKIFGPALAAITSGKVKNMDDVMKMDITALLLPMFLRLDPGDAKSFICEALAGTTVVYEGAAVTLANEAKIDLVFSGRVITMYRVIGYALQVNFADFGEAARASAAARGDQADTQKK